MLFVFRSFKKVDYSKLLLIISVFSYFFVPIIIILIINRMKIYLFISLMLIAFAILVNLFSPIILTFLICFIIKKNNNAILLELTLIIYLIEIFIIAYFFGDGYGNTPRPLLLKFLVFNLISLHLFTWMGFYCKGKIMIKLYIAFIITIALFNLQYSLILFNSNIGLVEFNGFPYKMVIYWLEPCVGSVKARNWDYIGIIKNLTVYFTVSFLLSKLIFNKNY
tara:strand:+ start:856 stop:1521 length:666 start_codon:yes stop_codon:yes gene_type:complete